MTEPLLDKVFNFFCGCLLAFFVCAWTPEGWWGGALCLVGVMTWAFLSLFDYENEVDQ